MMIAHYSAASLVADNKRLAQPAVTDNFITSGLQEDHLSFGESAALKLDKALDNAFYVLAIEYLLASQALDLIGSNDVAKGTSLAWKSLREVLPAYQEEHALHLDIQATYQRLQETQVIDKLLSIAPNLLPSRQPSY